MSWLVFVALCATPMQENPICCSAALRIEQSMEGQGSPILPELLALHDQAEDLVAKSPSRALRIADSLLMMNGLTVYVGDPALQAPVKEAMRQWQAAIPDTRLSQVASVREANVVAVGTTGLKVGGSDAGGFTSWCRNPDGDSPITAVIQIRTDQPNHRPMSSAQLIQIALHEFGHLYGLADLGVGAGLMAPMNLNRPILQIGLQDVSELERFRMKTYALRSLSLSKIVDLNSKVQ